MRWWALHFALMERMASDLEDIRGIEEDVFGRHSWDAVQYQGSKARNPAFKSFDVSIGIWRSHFSFDARLRFVDCEAFLAEAGVKSAT